MIKIQLKLKSFQPRSIEKALRKIKDILEFFEIVDCKKVKLPKTIKKFTVLRSPHIDKKSREQFEIQTYKTILSLKLYDLKIANFIIKLLKNSSLTGAQLEISIQTLNYFK